MDEEETTTPSGENETPAAAEAALVLGDAPPPAEPAADPEHVALVEALLYASGKPAPLARLAEAADLPPAAVEAALAVLERACAAPGRGVRVDRVAGGVRLVSRPEHDDSIRRLLGQESKSKLTIAALETLAIVAYRQPITAPEIAELRGVSSASSIRTLLDRKLITTAGRKEVVGTPFLYKTTKEFLIHFGLSELSELPKPEELEALYAGEVSAPPPPEQQELFPSLPEEPPAETGPTEAAPAEALVDDPPCPAEGDAVSQTLPFAPAGDGPCDGVATGEHESAPPAPEEEKGG